MGDVRRASIQYTYHSRLISQRNTDRVQRSGQFYEFQQRFKGPFRQLPFPLSPPRYSDGTWGIGNELSGIPELAFSVVVRSFVLLIGMEREGDILCVA